LAHDQVDHGQGNTRHNSSYDSDGFEDVEFQIAKGENPLKREYQCKLDNPIEEA
jgi:hypothetical protein